MEALKWGGQIVGVNGLTQYNTEVDVKGNVKGKDKGVTTTNTTKILGNFATIRLKRENALQERPVVSVPFLAVFISERSETSVRSIEWEHMQKHAGARGWSQEEV